MNPCLQEASTDLYPPIGRNNAHVDLDTLMRITSKPKRVLKTTNAYFYWVTREQGSFDWFKGVMNEIAELDQRVYHLIIFLFHIMLFAFLFANLFLQMPFVHY